MLRIQHHVSWPDHAFQHNPASRLKGVNDVGIAITARLHIPCPHSVQTFLRPLQTFGCTARVGVAWDQIWRGSYAQSCRSKFSAKKTLLHSRAFDDY